MRFIRSLILAGFADVSIVRAERMQSGEDNPLLQHVSVMAEENSDRFHAMGQHNVMAEQNSERFDELRAMNEHGEVHSVMAEGFYDKIQGIRDTHGDVTTGAHMYDPERIRRFSLYERGPARSVMAEQPSVMAEENSDWFHAMGQHDAMAERASVMAEQNSDRFDELRAMNERENSVMAEVPPMPVHMAELPTNVMAEQPESVMAEVPTNVMAEQPESVMAEQNSGRFKNDLMFKHDMRHLNQGTPMRHVRNIMAEQPESVMAELPTNVMAEAGPIAVGFRKHKQKDSVWGKLQASVEPGPQLRPHGNPRIAAAATHPVIQKA